MERNTLYPVFLKLDRLRMLIVGAGEVGCEKLTFLLKSSPDAHITVVAKEVLPPVSRLLQEYPCADVAICQKTFAPEDVRGFDLVIAATNFRALNQEVRAAAKAAGALVNVADTPALCDFYLGSIVTRGHLKVAISTNGQSPTFAKRFRQWLEQVLPEDTHLLLQNLKAYRDALSGDFEAKVRELNELTESLVRPPSKSTKR
ncbi:precorrin-2 dehydrogenase/sirohydrochlorin ferrochelatase family protein [Phaeodactylibacter luteus]|uniref:precorrin-2 dehydrogenase n=1 Tax=Phaeodactylibacter luteus TaxID=1564516 RepID=A0A5C6RN13_9BACT|nr:bifunctional precorrin-2 dehydrogenase/sirohydrochlorin ferrochelatase [Phaeodactylibacter luteus]TXB63597.1 bifunctional precorrin-2 dehydrogenase/sirohydrochlorin ferrochelatase [Phaeodactylibacter luteus]